MRQNIVDNPNAIVTDPVVAGGIYSKVSPEGHYEEAFMLNTRKDAISGCVHGNLLVFAKGNHPTPVVEDDHTMLGWELIRVAGAVASTLKANHLREVEEFKQRILDDRKARKQRR